MEEEGVIFTHVGAINADKSLFKVNEMQKQVKLAALTFCSAPNLLSAPDLMTITEVPSMKQVNELVDIVSQALDCPYAHNYNLVQKGDYTVLLWKSERFELAKTQPETCSTRFLAKALTCKVTGRVHMCAAVHRERGSHPRTFDAMHRSFDKYGVHDHINIFGDLNAKCDLIQKHFDEGNYNVGITGDIATTKAGHQCDNVIWDSDISMDSADVLCNDFCKLTHYPVQSFSYLQDVF